MTTYSSSDHAQVFWVPGVNSADASQGAELIGDIDLIRHDFGSQLVDDEYVMPISEDDEDGRYVLVSDMSEDNHIKRLFKRMVDEGHLTREEVKHKLRDAIYEPHRGYVYLGDGTTMSDEELRGLERRLDELGSIKERWARAKRHRRHRR